MTQITRQQLLEAVRGLTSHETGNFSRETYQAYLDQHHVRQTSPGVPQVAFDVHALAAGFALEEFRELNRNGYATLPASEDAVAERATQFFSVVDTDHNNVISQLEWDNRRAAMNAADYYGFGR